MANNQQAEYIQVDASRLFLSKAGDGHPLLLIHGASPRSFFAA